MEFKAVVKVVFLEIDAQAGGLMALTTVSESGSNS
jgi:hypothetical protein